MGVFQTGIKFFKSILATFGVLPGEDYITGLIFYNDSPPASFPSIKYKQLLSVQDAINVGITGLSEDATAAKSVYTLSAYGAAGDIVALYCQEPTIPGKVAVPTLLCQYTVVAGDSSTTLLAASLATAINANTAGNGGYTATSSSGVLTITAPKRLGIFLNSGTPFTATITGTVAGAWTQPTGSGGTTLGVASKFDIYYYHVSEFFRKNPKGILWLGIFSVPSSYDFAEVTTLQRAAAGKLRQVGVYSTVRTIVSNGATDLNSLQTVTEANATNKMPLIAVLSEDMSAVTDYTTLPNLSSLSDPRCSLLISQDGGAKGFLLYKATGKTIGNIGAFLGCLSVAAVSEDIANPIPKFNISDGTENEMPALGNGVLMNVISDTQQTQFDNFRFIYANAFPGYNGTYFSEDHSAVISNTNYSYIDQNRVYDKITRLLHVAYLPYLKSQLSLNEDGTLDDPTVFALESVGDDALLPMIQASELSAVRCVIDPNQNVLTSGKLIVTVYEINRAIARNIEININSVTSLPQ